MDDEYEDDLDDDEGWRPDDRPVCVCEICSWVNEEPDVPSGGPD